MAFKDSLGIAKITQINAYGGLGDDLPTLKYINSSKKNRFGFNLKEEENDFGIGYNDFKWRFSDQILGRFFTIDRLSEKFSNISTYQFASNDPINKLEIDGLEGVSVNKGIQNLIFVVQGRASINADKTNPGHTQVDNLITSGGNTYSVRDKGLGAISSGDFPANSQVITYSGTNSDLTPNDIVSTAYDFNKNNLDGNIFMIGHSQGAENVERASNALGKYGININVTVTLDAASASEDGPDNLTMSSNVSNAVNIAAIPTKLFNLSGATVSASNPNKTNVINHTSSSGVNHTNIDNTFANTTKQIINDYLKNGTVSNKPIITPHVNNDTPKGSSGY